MKPVELPGGGLGRLSIYGVVNVLAMIGATEVLALTSFVILGEGFAIATLERLHASARAASTEANARIVTADNKVMGSGELDGVVFSTTGLGVARQVVRDDGLRLGDVVMTTGTLGDHGLALLTARHGLGLHGDLRSDAAPLNGLIALAMAVAPIHAMKDPTRGGLNGALTELAEKARVGVQLTESAIPLSPAVRAASELLGMDPFAVANEGKALLGVAPEDADRILAVLQSHPPLVLPAGRDSARRGDEEERHQGDCARGAEGAEAGYGVLGAGAGSDRRGEWGGAFYRAAEADPACAFPEWTISRGPWEAGRRSGRRECVVSGG